MAQLCNNPTTKSKTNYDCPFADMVRVGKNSYYVCSHAIENGNDWVCGNDDRQRISEKLSELTLDTFTRLDK